MSPKRTKTKASSDGLKFSSVAWGRPSTGFSFKKELQVFFGLGQIELPKEIVATTTAAPGDLRTPINRLP